MDLPSSDWDEGPGLLESFVGYRWLVVALVVFCALVAFTWSVRQPVLYRGEVRVFLSSPPADVDPDRHVWTQVEFMTSPAVLTTAIRVSGAELTPGQLDERLTVEPADNADLITIHAVDSSPEGAARLTDAVATAYTRVLRQRARDGGAIAELEQTQERLKADLADIENRLRLQPNDVVLVADRRATLAAIRSVAARKQDVATRLEAEARSGSSPVKSPIPREPFQPQPAVTALIGAMVGLVGGGSLAWWLASRPGGYEVAHGHGRSGSDSFPGDAEEADDLETTVDFRQLSRSIQQIFGLLEGPGQDLYEQNVPQLVAEHIASRLPVEWVVVLLENGDGSLEVSGAVGLDLAKGEAALHFDGDLQEVLRAGPRLVGAEERGRLIQLGVSSGSAGSHLRVPLHYGRVGFGMVLAGQRGSDGAASSPVARLDLQEVGAQVRKMAPSLRAWLLLRSLNTRLNAFQ